VNITVINPRGDTLIISGQSFSLYECRVLRSSDVLKQIRSPNLADWLASIRKAPPGNENSMTPPSNLVSYAGLVTTWQNLAPAGTLLVFLAYKLAEGQNPSSHDGSARLQFRIRHGVQLRSVVDGRFTTR
jgi:hypothetical protein